MTSGGQRDHAFESLLQQTQALAKNIQNQHEQQQGPLSPPNFSNQQPQLPNQLMLGQSFMQQQGNLYNQAFDLQQLQNDFRNAAGPYHDAHMRNVSIDSDLAYDGIEELLIDSFMDAQDSKMAVAANASQMGFHNQQPQWATG